MPLAFPIHQIRRSRRRGALLLIACAVIGGMGCSSDRHGLADGTEAMVARLDSIADAAEADPQRNPYVNSARVRQLQAMQAPSSPAQQVQYRLQLGQELLRAGRNEEAIAAFEAVLAQFDAQGVPVRIPFRLAVEDLLAISYMRLGEEENCIDNHTVDRCLFPIRDSGVHTRTRGSLGAIRQYERILEAAPDNLNARWLLNVAHMTLGTWPDRVPAAWRIPREAVEAGGQMPRFVDIAGALGVDDVGLSGGSIMDDLNGDGYLDLMASSWGLRDPLRYFENQRDGTFADRTDAAGLEGLTGGLNLVHADYDNDGDLDVFVLRGAWLPQGHPNSLLRNNGDGTFSDVTEAAGLLSMRPTQTAAWGDYDNDGDLDLFIGNESHREAGRNPCELYRNDGDGTFTDVAAEVGVAAIGYYKGVLWGDVDNDGDLDLYLSDWERPNRLYRNDGPDENGRWRFREVGQQAGVSEPVESFPAWFWDYDNDGDLDLFVSGWRASSGDMAAEYLGLPIRAELPRLYRNRGDGTFDNVTSEAQLQKVLYTMGSNFGDLDNDGWLDFYAGTGDPDFRSLMPNRMFRNVRGEFFNEVTASGGFGHLQKGHAVSFGDLDNDGDQDLYTVMGGAFEGDVFNNALFENPGAASNWITLRLEGTQANRSAIGARIRVDVMTSRGEIRSIHRVVSSGGTFGASSLQEEIGLGDADEIWDLVVAWPGGEVQAFDPVAMNQVVLLREGAERAEPIALEPIDLARDAAGHGHMHP